MKSIIQAAEELHGLWVTKSTDAFENQTIEIKTKIQHEIKKALKNATEAQFPSAWWFEKKEEETKTICVVICLEQFPYTGVLEAFKKEFEKTGKAKIDFESYRENLKEINVKIIL